MKLKFFVFIFIIVIVNSFAQKYDVNEYIEMFNKTAKDSKDFNGIRSGEIYAEYPSEKLIRYIVKIDLTNDFTNQMLFNSINKVFYELIVNSEELMEYAQLNMIFQIDLINIKDNALANSIKYDKTNLKKEKSILSNDESDINFDFVIQILNQQLPIVDEESGTSILEFGVENDNVLTLKTQLNFSDYESEDNDAKKSFIKELENELDLSESYQLFKNMGIKKIKYIFVDKNNVEFDNIVIPIVD